MDGADCLNEENRAETDAQAMLLLARYAAMKETMWVARIDLTSEYPGPRSWHRTHGTLVASGWIEPGFEEEVSGLPKPVYRVTRLGHKECERLASLNNLKQQDKSGHRSSLSAVKGFLAAGQTNHHSPVPILLHLPGPEA